MDVPFAPLAHADVLQLVLQIAVLLGVARAFGEIAKRFGQPSVAGEILAGVVLGPSILGAFAPGVAGAWLPANPDQARMLEVVAMLGAMLLLVVTGLETDLKLIRRRAGAATGVALGGLLLPLAAGLALGWWFPADLIGDPGQRVVFALFLATAMAVSAIPVLASILLDLRLMRRDIGQTMLAAGMVDDLAGWAVLGFVIALAEGEVGVTAVLLTVATLLLFLALTAFVGPPVVRYSLRFVHGMSGTPHRFLTLAIVLVFVWASLSQALHLEPVIGAFAMGILLGRARRLPVSVSESLEQMTLGIFAPIFFAVAGLKVDIVGLLEPRLAFLTLVVIGVAIFGKVAGAYAGARWLTGADRYTSLAYGVGLTARGAIGIVVATIGRSLGILSPEVFSIVVVMAVVTSLMTPPALKAVLHRITPSDEESLRLRREDASAASLAGSIRRVLVPIRPQSEGARSTRVKSMILARLETSETLAVTVMSATDEAQRGRAEETVRIAARAIAPRSDVGSRVVIDSPVEAVLAEAAKGYDLLMLGATEVAPDLDSLFSSAVDEIIRMAPVPTLVVAGGAVDEDWTPRRILIPTDGSAAARRAADFAFAMADGETLISILHVLPPDISPAISVSDTGHVQRFDRAHQIVTDIRDRGDSLGVIASTMIEMGPEVDTAILTAAEQFGADLIVLGTAARTGTTRLYLGERVEQILTRSTCPVIVLNS